ncbi:hypothetical protein BJX96DRAFT_155871 [Aspergillus floccosus]
MNKFFANLSLEISATNNLTAQCQDNNNIPPNQFLYPDRMSDTRLMDIEPGGESTQYESIKMYTEPPEKQTGQMGVTCLHTKSEMHTVTPDSASTKSRDEDAEMAKQVGLGGSSSFLRGDTGLIPENQDGDAARSRRLQGYGPGSGVGA